MFLSREEAADALGVGPLKIDRYRYRGVDIPGKGRTYLQSLNTGDKGGKVRIPKATMKGSPKNYLGFDDFVAELVRRNEPQGFTNARRRKGVSV